MFRETIRPRTEAQIQRFASGNNPNAEAYCRRFIDLVKATATRPRVLVCRRRCGRERYRLHSDFSLALVGTDIYVSPYTVLVADGHRLPFCDESFEVFLSKPFLSMCLIQKLSLGFHRVLKPDGIVYAHTPFMQQVHEGAFDFTRFTLSGHRWLFRKFHHDFSGIVACCTALNWSIRYFVRALTGNERIAWSAAVATFWLRYFDRLARKRQNADAACGVFFFGRKAEAEISPKSMIDFYKQQSL